jgi:hypothetical protein
VSSRNTKTTGKMYTLSTSRILACIYTCEGDKQNLSLLKQTDWYKTYSSMSNFKFIDVYASEGIECDYLLKGSMLTVKTKESYDNLSVKTIQMIKSCRELFDFDFLIKIDSSIISDASSKVHDIFSFENFVSQFDDKFLSEDYNGYVPIMGNTIDSFKGWARSKNLTVMPELIFGSLGYDNWPSRYWGGKCYILSNTSIDKLIKNEDLFHVFKDHMGACEDFCVGTILKDKCNI